MDDESSHTLNSLLYDELHALELKQPHPAVYVAAAREISQ